MSSSIGSSPQVQQNIIQNSVQKNPNQPIKRNIQNPAASVLEAQINKNFEQLGQEVIAKRTNGLENAQAAVQERGQVVDLLV